MNFLRLSISNWVKILQGIPNKPRIIRKSDYLIENRRLKRELEEMRKENAFLKKSGGILCEGNRLMVYRFIDNNKKNFEVRWLLQRFKLSANAYYNYLKGRKDGYRTNKKKIKDTINTIYHGTNGILEYRTMKIFLERKGIFISKLTTHKYMNKDLQIKSVNQKKKPNYKHGNTHKKFANLIN